MTNALRADALTSHDLTQEMPAEELTADEQHAIEELNQLVARDIAAGKPKEIIIQDLMALDWPEESARQLVDNVEQEVNRHNDEDYDDIVTSTFAKQGKRRMLTGALWAIGGTVVTLFTYGAASNGGGSYVVAWGAILFGIIDFIRGFADYVKYK